MAQHMKSPFPGMDPFIESCGLWEDFHGHLIEKMGDALADAVPDRYVVRTAERSYVVLEDDDDHKAHPFKPDVSVMKTDTDSAPVGSVLLAEPGPISMQAFIEDEYRERFIEIREASGGGLVTAIEVLSSTNKKPNSVGWDVYKRKRQGLFMERSANFVEIDLLRGGTRMPMVDEWPKSPYTLLVARCRNMPMCKVWPGGYRQRLPVIPIPLAGGDPDVDLDLQPMIEAIYVRYRYGRSIDYHRTLSPALEEAESAWVREQVEKTK